MPDAWQVTNESANRGLRKALDAGKTFAQANAVYNKIWGAHKAKARKAALKKRARDEEAEYRRQDYT